MLTALALWSLVLFPPGALAQTIPGCHDGRLTDPEAYFRSVVGNTPYSDARLVSIQPALRLYGIEIQHDGSGNLRPRLYLPTGSDPYGHAVDIEAGGAWAWVDRGGPYAASTCGAIPPLIPSTDLAPVLSALTVVDTRIVSLDMALWRLDARVVAMAASLEAHRTEVQKARNAIVKFFGKYLAGPIAAALVTWQATK